MTAEQRISKSMVTARNLREQSREWLNPLNLHWAGVGVLGIVCVYLLVQMGLAWRLANSQDAAALAQQRTELRSAQIAAKPLEGLDVKLASASEQADRFYRERLPMNYSEIATELGVLKNKSGVRLAKLNYSQPVAGKSSALPNPIGPDEFGGKLTEVSMDASFNGEYRPLVLFINGLERDKVFFLITGVTLTGQQTGTVSLRIRLTTFLRGIVPGEGDEKADDAGSPQSDADKAIDAQTIKTAGKAGPPR
jgi:hypothetical protein